MGEKGNKALFWGGQAVALACVAGQVAAEVYARPRPDLTWMKVETEQLAEQAAEAARSARD